MKKKHLVFVLRSSPYGHTKAQEGLDALMAASVFEQPISVIFSGDGVFQLMAQQQPGAQKNFSKMLNALKLYEIDNIHIQESALKQRDILSSQILAIGKISSDVVIADILKDADHLLTF
jgi:tRNA 2-thiouridine synthesizing protein C